MKDLHTHILPGMDDGAQNVETSLQMLHREFEQGVDTVALTPHFYRDREHPEEFLRRRRNAYETLTAAISALPEAERAALPRLLLGAEVAWVPNLTQVRGLEQMCYGDSRFLLVEPPFCTWGDDFFNQLYDLMNCIGLTPVIAHVDRYWGFQNRAQLETLFAMDVPVQLSTEALLHFATRTRALRLIRAGRVQMLITDAHDLSARAPNMAQALTILKKKLGGGERLTRFDLGAP